MFFIPVILGVVATYTLSGAMVGTLVLYSPIIPMDIDALGVVMMVGAMIGATTSRLLLHKGNRS